MAPARENKFTLLLSDEERDMLQELAEAEGLDASSFLRSTIRRTHGARFGSKKVKTKR